MIFSIRKHKFKLFFLSIAILFFTVCSAGDILPGKQQVESQKTVNLKTQNLSFLKQLFTQNTLNENSFLDLITKFNEASSSLLLKDELWLNQKAPKKEINNILKNGNNSNKPERPQFYGNFDCLPHALKLTVNQKSNVFVCGDLHGNFESLKIILEDLIKKNYLSKDLVFKENNYLFLLGDYADHDPRDHVETLAALFILKIKNPRNIFLLAGNHEEIEICKKGCLGDIIRKSYKSKEKEIFNSLDTFFNLLPATAYLSYENLNKNTPTQIYQLSHGAIDIRYNPQKLLDNNYSEKICFSMIDLMTKEEIKKYLPNDSPIESLLDYINLKDKTFGFRYNNLQINDITTLPEINKLIDQTINQETLETINSNKLNFLHDFLEPNTSSVFIKEELTKELSVSHKFICDFLTKTSSNKNKIVGLIRGHHHYFPKIINKKIIDEPSSGVGITIEKSELFPNEFKIVTVISGENIRMFLKFQPTYLQLSPPNENKIWNIMVINL